MSLETDIFRFRVENDISQEKLAKLCKVNTMTINQIENGKKKASKFTEGKIRMIIGGEKE